MATPEELLNTWQNGNYINPDALQAAYELVEQLKQRIETLETQVKALTGN